ncbi:MAG: YcnI family protein [Rhodospirillaceae bacterium]|jgi:periplasmic copper chaperone A|nr:YcnI family protein [Rhodospirillaceae bacterium]MBT5239049.1 YcnI family protein [Rhodospirillaceae bacterium]MBT5565370.1 YcnI family protein [Rhodospirillaceae bacterium]MBT6089109.1 YcnI family protein [Rhodospirillaceae bacterium]MBT7451498.1 YcnI family protein [Rhodospirillaceae bacterium]
MSRTLISTLAIAAGLALSTSAFGHALSVDKDAPAGGWHLVQIGIPHGCAGSATTGMRIRIPDGIFMVRPEVKAGWDLSMNMRTMEPPITSEGVTYSTSVDEIIWRGGTLGNLEFDRFNFLALMPRKEHETVYFLTIQECEEGENKWVEVPEEGRSWGSYGHPAPFVKTGILAPRRAPAETTAE